jgi:Zn-dependent alcohol dehydrogenase
MAKEFGATHVINTAESNVDFVEEVKSITSGGGASVVVDTTGNMNLIQNGMEFTGNRGQMVILGVPPPDGMLSVHLISFMQVC